MAKGKNRRSRTGRRAGMRGMSKGWPGGLIVTPLKDDGRREIEARCDFSDPFWVGKPTL